MYIKCILDIWIFIWFLFQIGFGLSSSKDIRTLLIFVSSVIFVSISSILLSVLFKFSF